MINRQNWQLTKKYLEYRRRVDQVLPVSLEKERTHLRYLLEWVQETSFQSVPSFMPTFPEFLLSSRLDGAHGRLSAVYVKKILSTARLFFTWLSDNQSGYKHIKQGWVKTLKIKRLSDTPKNREVVTFEEIQAIAAAPAVTIQERRVRAALCFLYLSGMRIGAFVSLPVSAVNIQECFVNQFPSLGVRTKGGKHAKTFLLDIPELLRVVEDWHNEVSFLGSAGLWFPLLSFETGKMITGSAGLYRSNLARRNFRDWLARVGLPYHSPHKFRHGHIHYGLKCSKNLADFKAVSLNVMHSTIQITDEFYSVLGEDEVKERLSGFTKSEISESGVVEVLEELLSKLKK